MSYVPEMHTWKNSSESKDYLSESMVATNSQLLTSSNFTNCNCRDIRGKQSLGEADAHGPSEMFAES